MLTKKKIFHSKTTKDPNKDTSQVKKITYPKYRRVNYLVKGRKKKKNEESNSLFGVDLYERMENLLSYMSSRNVSIENRVQHKKKKSK